MTDESTGGPIVLTVRGHDMLCLGADKPLVIHVVLQSDDRDAGLGDENTARLSWRALLTTQWEALRRRVLRIDPLDCKLSEISQACQTIAAVAAWYESAGNVTHAALRVGTSRQALRKRVKRWLKENQIPIPRERATRRPK